MFSKTLAIAALAAVASAAPQLDFDNIPQDLQSAVDAIFSTGLPIDVPSILPSTYANAGVVETYLASAYAPLRSALPTSLLGEYDSVVSSLFRAEASAVVAAQSNPAALNSLASSINGIVASATPTITKAPSTSSPGATAQAASTGAGSSAPAGNSAAAGGSPASTGTSTAGAVPTANAAVLKVAGLAGAAVGAAAFLL